MSELTSLPVVAHEGDPALMQWAVHFTGRARSERNAVPVMVGHLNSEQRLASMFLTGWAYGFPSFQTGASSVLSFSDVSAAELRNSFAQGLNGQGRCEPWALVLRRDRLWDLGVRPALYVDEDRSSWYSEAALAERGPGWDALVQPTRITWTPSTGKRDWLNEREWRFCWPPTPSPARLDISKAIVGLVVGRKGWDPSSVVSLPRAAGSVVPSRAEAVESAFRWVWDDEQGVLREDGRVSSVLVERD